MLIDQEPAFFITLFIDDSKSQSFFDQLVTKIIDNLQFNIEQIHIRYEDKISNPAFPFSIGFTLRSVSAVSTDSQWLETFVHESMDSVHKLLQLNGLAIYQNTRNNFTSFTRDVGRDYISSFEFLIPNDTPQISCGNDNNFAQFATAKDHQYLLEPVSGHGKLIVHKTIKSLVKKYSKPTNFIETFENIVAKHSLHVDFDKLGFSLDMEQYQELLKMIKMFHRFHQMKKYRGFRPEVSCEVDPKAWFQYAIRSALLDIEEINEKWTWKFISEHIRKKKIYEDLHTIRMRPSILAGLSNSPFQQLTTEQKTQLEALERDLEYEDLAFFRLNVLKKLEVEAKELSSLQPGSGTASETPAVMNWFSTMWNWGRPQEKPQVVTKTPDIFLGENNLSLGNEDVRLNRDDMDRLLETIDYHEDSESLLDSTTLQSSTENLMSPSGFFASTLLASSKSPTQRSITYYITKQLSCHVKRASFKLKRKTELLLNVLLDSIRFGFMEQRQ